MTHKGDGNFGFKEEDLALKLHVGARFMDNLHLSKIKRIIILKY